jgi:N-acetylglucosaminyldiphosphoundecaprenol N-acetyl-beta-D-mannosaminyltransferase
MHFWLTKKTAYNDFSGEFSQTRKIPLPEFSLFEEALKDAKKILYIGCGNGRNIPLLAKKNREVVGLDASEGLLEEAKKNSNLQSQASHLKFVHGFAENLPFQNEEFDAVVAFASLHHITSKKKRKKAFSEAYRVLKKDGVFLGTVWNLFQKRFAEHEKKAKKRARFLPWWNENDFFIPWGQQKLPRLYYRFSADKLENILQKSGFLQIETFGQKENGKKGGVYEGKNICFVGKKIPSPSLPLFPKKGAGGDFSARKNSSPTLPLQKRENKKRIFVLGVPFDPVTKSEVLEKMEEYAAGEKQMFATTPNPEICMTAQKDKEFLKILQSADLSFADGIGILWAANKPIKNSKFKIQNYLIPSLISFALHKKSKYLPEQVCGSDVFREFCSTSKHPIFLLGGAPGAAKKCQEIFGKNIVDTDDGSSKPDDEERIIEKINASGAKVLFVAFGAPTQEKWIKKNLEKMPNIRLAMGIGGSFDFISGAQKRAPKFAQKIGMEWAWRLLLEPKKRGKRILTAVWSFPRKVWKS